MISHTHTYCFPCSQAAWTLKTRALTAQVYVDEVDWDEEGIAEMLMDDNVIAQVARPGTSLRQPGASQGGPSQGMRLKQFSLLARVEQVANLDHLPSGR